MTSTVADLDQRARRPDVEGTLNYLHRRYGERGETIEVNVDVQAKDENERVPQKVLIRNAWRSAGEIALEKNGFALARHKTAVTDFFDRRQIDEIYYPEAKELMRGITGADEVLAFGDYFRSGVPDPSRDIGETVRQVHVDYDVDTTRRFAEALAGPAEAAKLLRKRFALINIWRPLASVESDPLAVCDGTTVAPADLVPVVITGGVRPKPGHPTLPRVKGSYNAVYNPDHRWYYYPEMQPDEVLLIKIADSDPDRVQRVAHTGFVDPTSRPDAAPRSSVEIRLICFFPN